MEGVLDLACNFPPRGKMSKCFPRPQPFSSPIGASATEGETEHNCLTCKKETI